MPEHADWRFRHRCEAMFFDGFPNKGICAAGGPLTNPPVSPSSSHTTCRKQPLHSTPGASARSVKRCSSTASPTRASARQVVLTKPPASISSSHTTCRKHPLHSATGASAESVKRCSSTASPIRVSAQRVVLTNRPVLPSSSLMSMSRLQSSTPVRLQADCRWVAPCIS